MPTVDEFWNHNPNHITKNECVCYLLLFVGTLMLIAASFAGILLVYIYFVPTTWSWTGLFAFGAVLIPTATCHSLAFAMYCRGKRSWFATNSLCIMAIVAVAGTTAGTLMSLGLVGTRYYQQIRIVENISVAETQTYAKNSYTAFKWADAKLLNAYFVALESNVDLTNREYTVIVPIVSNNYSSNASSISLFAAGTMKSLFPSSNIDYATAVSKAFPNGFKGEGDSSKVFCKCIPFVFTHCSTDYCKFCSQRVSHQVSNIECTGSTSICWHWTHIRWFARLSELDNWWCCHFGYVGVLCYLLPLCMLFGTIPKASTKMIN